jgi:hypothetical protein
MNACIDAGRKREREVFLEFVPTPMKIEVKPSEMALSHSLISA